MRALFFANIDELPHGNNIFFEKDEFFLQIKNTILVLRHHGKNHLLYLLRHNFVIGK
jgi:hypothetical protein